MSEPIVTSSPWHCSGDMYSGVPIVMPVIVRRSADWMCEIPKSIR